MKIEGCVGKIVRRSCGVKFMGHVSVPVSAGNGMMTEMLTGEKCLMEDKSYVSEPIKVIKVTEDELEYQYTSDSYLYNDGRIYKCDNPRYRDSNWEKVTILAYDKTNKQYLQNKCECGHRFDYSDKQLTGQEGQIVKYRCPNCNESFTVYVSRKPFFVVR